MSEQTSGVDESGFGAGGESSIDADIDSSGVGSEDQGTPTYDSESADENVADSYSADVAAGYDDPSDSPVEGETEQDGSWKS